MINKKGALGDMMLIATFIFVMVMIGSGIALGVFFFVGDEIDFRGMEAGILNHQIVKCIAERDIVFSDNSDSNSNLELLYERCRLNKDVIEKHNQIKICARSADWSGNREDCIGYGDPIVITGTDFTACALLEKNKFLGCSMTRVFQDSKGYIVIATSKQKIRRVSG